MATEFISNSWLMPTNANEEANRLSNFSLDFDGSNDEIDCGSISQTNEGDISFSAWCNVTASGTYQAILSSTDTSSKAGINIVLRNDGKIKFERNQDTSNTRNNTGYAVAGFSFGSWHHLCGTFNSTSGELKAYINGVLQATSSDTSAGASTTNSLHIGRLSDSSNYPANGKIAETVIYDYTLSGSQVLELYGTGSAIGNPMSITNGRKPVAYYPLGNAAFNSEFLVPNSAEKDFVFDFDGSNDYISFPADASLNISTANHSMSFWLKTTDSGICVVSQKSGTELAAWIQSSKIKWAAENPFSSTSNINDGTWKHICFVADGSSSYIYINGVLDATGGSQIRSSASGSAFAIGSRPGSFPYEGLISNWALFNTALPATGTESVESLYNYGTPPNIASYSNLQAWWELDASATFDGSNWSIPDASSNSNTGTSSGMTAANLVQSDLIINAPYDPFSLSFDGVDERISFTETNLGLNNSISIWFKRPSTGTNVLIGQGSAWYDYAVRIESNGSIKYADRYTSPTITFDNASTKLVVNTVNTWVNIVIVRTGSTANLYVNGVDYDGSKSWGSGSEEGTVFNRLAIGGDGSSYGFNGQLSNFSSWNTSLTSAQALEVYNEAKPSNLNNHSASSSLVSWYRLGAVNTFYNSTTTEFTVLDEVGTNEGTSVNMEQGDLVDGVGATGSGTSSGMSSGTNKTGDAPYSDNNAVSYNMSVTAKSTSVPT